MKFKISRIVSSSPIELVVSGFSVKLIVTCSAVEFVVTGDVFTTPDLLLYALSQICLLW